MNGGTAKQTVFTRLQRAELGADIDGHDSSTAQRREERGQCGLLGLEAIDEEGQKE